MKLLISADWHLRADVPISRKPFFSTEEWLDFQKEIITEVFEDARERGIPVVVVGDIFHWGIVHPSVVNMLLGVIKENLDVPFYIMPGNHDLLYHQTKFIYRSSFGILWNLRGSLVHDVATLGLCFHFGEVLPEEFLSPELVFMHELSFRSKEEQPPGKSFTAHELLLTYKQASHIFIGDNHHRYLYQASDGRKVLSPGCLIRQTADMIDDTVGYYVVDTEKEDGVHLVNIDDGELSDAHLEDNKEDENTETIRAFLKQLNKKSKTSVDFIENLHYVLRTGDIPPVVQSIVENILTEIKGGV